MPKIRSAKKRARQTVRRTLRNRLRKERLKKVLRAFATTVQAKESAAIGAELRKAHKALDKAGNKGILHRNAVNRKKSRLAKAAAKAAKAATA